MELNDLISKAGLEPEQVVVLRHRPYERRLKKVLPWLAAERPDLFNAYQQTQGAVLEKVMANLQGSGHVASFVGHEPGKALFIGFYSIGSTTWLTREEYWTREAFRELRELGMEGFVEEKDPRPALRWFELELRDLYSEWKGKLIIQWPPPERSWWRRAHRNRMPIAAIVEESLLDPPTPPWNELVLTWSELEVLPRRLRSALRHWRGVYYIHDLSDGKGYVGSAYGEENILGRWRDYAQRGHGGNVLLRKRNPETFRFSILQRVSPDLPAEEVIGLETSWKDRLHTRKRDGGLNDN